MKTSKRTQIAQAVLSADLTGNLAVLAADLNPNQVNQSFTGIANSYPQLIPSLSYLLKY
ncbi:hypothetical protein L4D76_22540 [Photobacterium sagamiensis]|uniref:hypothetical protein n=1 Tax=Photobacterium sagamiensis TaxID=2910241 RepID=UPI003D0C98C5